MAKKATLSLNSDDRLRLQNIVNRGMDWRERQRSQTLILMDDGLSMQEVSEIVEINIRTVGLTRMDWLKRGFESLVDAPRSGAPKKITAEQLEKIVEAAKQEPLTANALLGKHIAFGGLSVHVNTITKTLKKAGFVWKRTRASLKKNETKPLSELPKQR